VGAGWNREEMANHGTDPRRRMAVLRERVEAMKEIWTNDEASYAGEYVSFERIWSWPKPAQRLILRACRGTGPGVLDACWPSATRGSPTTPVTASWTARRNCALAPTGRSRLWSWRARRRQGARGLRRSRLPAGRALAALGRARPVERALDRYEAAIAEFHGE